VAARQRPSGDPAQFQKLLRQGWHDALRALHPDAALYTYWSYLRNRWPRDAGLRIDHLLLSALAAKRLVAAGVDREVRGGAGASDHAPAWVELKEAGGGPFVPARAARPVAAARDGDPS
jgi:exodeoxyribonuclease III